MTALTAPQARQLTNAGMALAGLMFAAWPAATADEWRLSTRGRAHLDGGFVSGQNGSLDTSRIDVRRLRLGVDAAYGSAWRARAELEFASLDEGEVDFMDMTLEYRGPVSVRVGYFRGPAPLDNQTSTNTNAFVERAAYAFAFNFTRQIGAEVGWRDGNWTWITGLFRDTLEDRRTNTQWQATSRLFHAIEEGDRVRHMGMTVRYRQTAGDQPGLRYATRPDSLLAPATQNTGPIAGNDLFAGAEAFLRDGPGWFQGEAMVVKADLQSPLAGNRTYWSAYGAAGWVFGGGYRTYGSRAGVINKVTVPDPITRGGWGAFEVAGRLDHIDLGHQSVAGTAGRKTSVALGLNWFPVEQWEVRTSLSHGWLPDGQDYNTLAIRALTFF